MITNLNLNDYIGRFIDTDGILPDLNGRYLAEYLKSQGYKVNKYYDTGKNGQVVLSNGLQVSTNGYVCYTKDNK